VSVTISWLTQSSETQPAGGDVIDYAYAAITLDGSASERYVSDASATEHPVELGADISDHVKVGLRQVTIEAVVSAHPGPSSAANVTLDPPYGFRDWENAAADRPNSVRQQLEQLKASGTEVEIETPVGLYESMLILGIEESRTADSGDGLRATITAREFRRVATEEVDAPAPRVERGRRTADSGTQEGGAADVPPSTEDRTESAWRGLSRLLDPSARD